MCQALGQRSIRAITKLNKFFDIFISLNVLASEEKIKLCNVIFFITYNILNIIAR